MRVRVWLWGLTGEKNRTPAGDGSPRFELRVAGGAGMGVVEQDRGGYVELVDTTGQLGAPLRNDLVEVVAARGATPGRPAPPIVRAAGLKVPPPTRSAPGAAPADSQGDAGVFIVVDATAGLGRDAAVLAGCVGPQSRAVVTLAVERSPVVAALLADGVRRGVRATCTAPQPMAFVDAGHVVVNVDTHADAPLGCWPTLAGLLRDVCHLRTPSSNASSAEFDSCQATAAGVSGDAGRHPEEALLSGVRRARMPVPVLGSAEQVLDQMTQLGVAPDVVYVDPMFHASGGLKKRGQTAAQRRAKPKRDLQYLMALTQHYGGEDERDTGSTAVDHISHAAWRAGCRRLVLKRQPKAASWKTLPADEGNYVGIKQPLFRRSHCVETKRVRYDVFVRLDGKAAAADMQTPH